MKTKPQKGKPAGSELAPGTTADELPERRSVQRKTELVLRLLRGEAALGECIPSATLRKPSGRSKLTWGIEL